MKSKIEQLPAGSADFQSAVSRISNPPGPRMPTGSGLVRALRTASRRYSRLAIGAAFTVGLLAPSPLLACAACYGKSDSALASGMNWGIFTLLGVVLTVLACVAVFFVHIVRKEESDDQTPPPENPTGL